MKEFLDKKDNSGEEDKLHSLSEDLDDYGDQIDDSLFNEIDKRDISHCSASSEKTLEILRGEDGADTEYAFEGLDLQEKTETHFETTSRKEEVHHSDHTDHEERPILEQNLSLESKVEAIVFAAEKPIRATEILEILLADEGQYSLGEIDAALRYLDKMYQERNGGFILEHVKGEGYRFQTVLGVTSLMQRMFSARPRPLSRAAFETLSIIAYRQPVTRAEIEYIRMVDAGSIIKNLMDRGLIYCRKRKEEAGRPMLFETTDEFLKVFKLKNINDLPPLSSFQPSLEVLAQAKKPMDDEKEIVMEQLFGEENAQDQLTEETGDN